MRGILAAALLAWLLLGHAASGQAFRLAVIGDSLTDEYQGQSDQPALGWVEQLVLARNFDVGPRTGDPTLRGEPRNDGFAHNWARFGMNLIPPSFSDLNLFQQHPLLRQLPPFSSMVDGLTGDVMGTDFDAVYIGFGANDFLIHLFDSGRFEGAIFDDFRRRLMDALFDVVDAVRRVSDVPIFVGAIPQIIPPHQVFHPPLSPPVDEFVYTSAVLETNGMLELEARRHGAFFANLFQSTQILLSVDGQIHIGGFSIPFESIARFSQLVPKTVEPHGPCATNADLCATRDYALNFWLHDRVHPNTLVQGLMANDFIGALNLELGTSIAPLTEAELLDLAFQEPAFVPEPGSALLVLSAALLGWATRRHQPDRARSTVGPTSWPCESSRLRPSGSRRKAQ